MAKKILLTLMGFLILISTSYGATYTVTITSDANVGGGGNPGELRWAINQANATAGPDIVDFNIPGTGPFTILPNAQLPILNDMTGGRLSTAPRSRELSAVCRFPL